MTTADTTAPAPTPAPTAPQAPSPRRRVPRERLREIEAKVRAGERLDLADGCDLFASNDIHFLGRLADSVKRRHNGDTAFYNVNRHINPTNICVLTNSCKFCAFAARPQDSHAYAMSHQEIYDRAGKAWADGATELHLVGGLHPKLPFEWFCEMLSGLRTRYPRLHRKAFTAIEILWFARMTKKPVDWVLRTLMDAGLDSMPGGGAETFDEAVRKQIARGKEKAHEWLDVHRTAHGLGLKSNATLLYGHIETEAHRVDHFLRLRALQDETGGFQTFIPLEFHPDNTHLSHLPRATGLDALKTIAVARLMLDNFPHIKAFWIMVGVKLAAVSLRYGADDIDGTVTEERITHAAGADTPQSLSIAEIRRLIEESGCTPVERDTLYRKVNRVGRRWWVDGEPEPLDEPTSLPAAAGASVGPIELPQAPARGSEFLDHSHAHEHEHGDDAPRLAFSESAPSVRLTT
jgi:aminodeoxyfutalosine synthase